MGLSGLSGLTGLSGEMGGGLWWLAGGVAKANVFGAYQGKGMGSYAASKVNLNQPGTNDLVETGPPDWSAALGWQGGAVTQFFTLVGCRPTETWSMLIQYANAAANSQQFCGNEGQAALGPIGFSISNTGGFQTIVSGGNSDAVGGVQVSGNSAIAGKSYFRDGALTTALTAGAGGAAWDLMLLCDNWIGTAHGGQHATEVRAFAIYTVTLTNAQVAAVAAAMAAL